jgi:phenylalanyl-tRNA synthetase alpha chain
MIRDPSHLTEMPPFHGGAIKRCRMSANERKTAGPVLNALKDETDAALRACKARLDDVALHAQLAGEWLDVTLPARP